MPIINDNRRIEGTSVAEADELFAQLAQLEISIRKKQAAADKRIADIKAALEDDTAADRAALKILVDELSLYITSHKDRFVKPRKRKTPWGTYGLRTATKLEVLSEEALMAISDKFGLDLYKTSTAIDKKQVEKAISDGFDLQGAAAIISGDLATYDIDKALLAK